MSIDTTTGDLTDESGPEADARLPGQVLGGRYLLREVIGEGGMAQVWRAEHLTLHRPVAVKFLRLSGDSAVVRARFLREARIAAAVRHRYVVDILDFGAAPDGTPFMVMELVEGRTLGARLDEGPALSLADVIRITARLLAGLDAVHAAGIVHGDLKPDNVALLVEAGEEDMPKLLDFGISRLSRRDETSRIRSVVPTEDRDILGTPPYMSPEQAGGREMDPRSDLFTVGSMLYEMLAGQRAFDDENALRIVAAVRECRPVPLASLRPDLPPELLALVNRAMAVSPADRFASASEMRTALLEAARAHVEARVVATQMTDGSMAPQASVDELARVLADHGSDPSAPTPGPTRAGRGLWLVAALATFVALLIGAAGFAWSRVDRSRVIPLEPRPEASTSAPQITDMALEVRREGGQPGRPGDGQPGQPGAGQPGAGQTGDEQPGEGHIAAEGDPSDMGDVATSGASSTTPGAAATVRPRSVGASRRRADLVRDPGF